MVTLPAHHVGPDAGAVPVSPSDEEYRQDETECESAKECDSHALHRGVGESVVREDQNDDVKDHKSGRELSFESHDVCR